MESEILDLSLKIPYKSLAILAAVLLAWWKFRSGRRDEP